jgi:hypothetical protein
MGMKRFMLSITEDMEKALERERKKRMLGSIPETARVIIGEYFSSHEEELRSETRSYLGKHESQTVK